MNLQEWQESFFSCLQMQDIDSPLREQILETPEFSSSERLDVYLYAYQKRISDSLRDDFPVLMNLLGSEDFSTLCSEFLKYHTSRSPNLADLSRSFVSFLETQLQHLSKHGALLELAQAEWILCEIFHTPVQPSATPQEWQLLSQSLPNKICFVVDTSVRVQKWQWPIAKIWLSKKWQDKADSFSVSYRNRQGKCIIEALDEFQFELLTLICNGASLGHLSEWAANLNPQVLPISAPEAIARFQVFFQKLVADGVILRPKLNR